MLVVFGALLSSDPGDIHDTIAALVADRIQVSIVGLAAQVAICSEICSRTNGGANTGAGASNDDGDGAYAVATNDAHFRDLLLAKTTPPAARAERPAHAASLLMMASRRAPSPPP